MSTIDIKNASTKLVELHKKIQNILLQLYCVLGVSQIISSILIKYYYFFKLDHLRPVLGLLTDPCYCVVVLGKESPVTLLIFSHYSACVSGSSILGFFKRLKPPRCSLSTKDLANTFVCSDSRDSYLRFCNNIYCLIVVKS